MNKLLPHNFDRTNGLIALGVWLTAMVVYFLTKAPTLSFWDCGEFIAACHILGIPHPPGTPLYVMVGRIFSLIPTSADISARINFLSGLCSSLAALFAYLAGVRILRDWFSGDNSLYSKIIMFAGAASGALFLSFGRTQWTNSVETEVYGMSMMIVFGIVWLTMIFVENRGTLLADKILLLVVYLSFLGIGVHMTTFIILPICAVIFILKKDTPIKFWFMLAAFFLIEFYLIFALSSRPGEIPYYIPIVIGFTLYLFYILSFERIPLRIAMIAVGFLLSCLPLGAALFGLRSPAWNITGLVAFGALLVYGSYMLFRYISGRKRSDDPDNQSLISAVIIFGTALMVAILISDLKGYGLFLIITIALALILGLYGRKFIRWPILIALLCVSLVILGMNEYFWASIIALVISIGLGLKFKADGWQTAIMIVLVAAAGFSVHGFIPIRSSLQPTINENNPSRSLATTIGFIERKQYGSQGMIERMFVRRAEWENAFGNTPRMGFWGFFSEQYGLKGKPFILFFLVGVFGIWEACRRKPRKGLFLLLLLLLATVGLVLYMNFADGARQHPVTGADYREVRDRDYFFSPGFMVFGLAIGLGVTGLVQFGRDLTKKLPAPPRRVIAGGMLALFLTPVITIAGNYYYCDRSNNYIPFDYASNLLNSADQNAVLFTNGDNDTFPLWCLQEVYGIRKDVRVINLALSNTDWYIRQIRDNMGLELGWTDDQISALRSFRYPPPDKRVFRIQDQVIDAIVANNGTRVPINYSVTCSGSSRKMNGQNIDSLLVLRGMAFRLTNTPGKMRIDIENTLNALTNPEFFKYRGWNDPGIHKNETTMRLTTNVVGTFLMLAEALRQDDRMDEAVEVVRFAVEKIPHAGDAVETLANLYAVRGNPVQLEELLRETIYSRDRRYLEALLGRAYRVSGDMVKAREVLLNLLDKYSDYRPALDELMVILVGERDMGAMLSILQVWVARNPRDREMKQALEALVNELNALNSDGSDSL